MISPLRWTRWLFERLTPAAPKRRRGIVHYAPAGLPVCYRRRHSLDGRVSASNVPAAVTCPKCRPYLPMVAP
jgi:hypothetical protein